MLRLYKKFSMPSSSAPVTVINTFHEATILLYIRVLYYQLMQKRIVFKGVLKFTLKLK